MTNQTQTDRLAEVLDAPTITQAEEWLRGELQSAFQAADPEATHKFDWADFGPYGATDRGKLVIAALSPRIAATQSLSTDLANAEARAEDTKAALFATAEANAENLKRALAAEAENARLREALETMLDEDDGGMAADKARAALDASHGSVG